MFSTHFYIAPAASMLTPPHVLCNPRLFIELILNMRRGMVITVFFYTCVVIYAVREKKGAKLKRKNGGQREREKER